MKIYEDEEIFSLIEYLYQVNSKWDVQDIWISNIKDQSRGYPKYKDENKIYKMRDEGLIEIIDDPYLLPDGKVFFDSIEKFQCFHIRFDRKKIIDHVIRNKTLKWGCLTIKPKGIFEIDGIRPYKKKFTFCSQSSRFIGYLLILEEASIEELGSLFGITINKYRGQTMAERVRKIKRNAVLKLIKYGMPESYASKMFRPDTGAGYSLEDFLDIDTKPVTDL